ncbi:hypothetical protein M5689_011020 [Euphorbia peplus]|nr:hypothetical protein M5689_011020 [Euphorbia peplus]
MNSPVLQRQKRHEDRQCIETSIGPSMTPASKVAPSPWITQTARCRKLLAGASPNRLITEKEHHSKKFR